jgi:hypothetical protein
MVAAANTNGVFADTAAPRHLSSGSMPAAPISIKARSGEPIHVPNEEEFQTEEEVALCKSADKKLFFYVLLLNCALMFVNYLDR